MGALNNILSNTVANEAAMINSHGREYVSKVYSQAADHIAAEYDFSEVIEAINRMQPSLLRSTFKKIFRHAGNTMRNPVKAEVRRAFPGGKSYPRSPNRQSGYLRGKYYGPLYKDVRMSVYKNAKGVNVNIFTPNKGKVGRQAVLQWLNHGTEVRGSQGSTYSNRGRKDQAFVNHNGLYRGKISAANFFDRAVENLETAANDAASNFEKQIIAAFNKQQTNNSE